MLKVSVPATVANIGPGFDCLGISLEYYNVLKIELLERSADLEIAIAGQGEAELSKGTNNLVYRALAHVYQKVGFTLPSLRLKLENKVPLARGLGSSACAIVAGLLSGNYLCGQPLSQMELLDLAVELEGHPDNVAPALLGGLVISAPKDDKSGYHYLKLDPPKGLRAVLCVPNFTVNTEDARQVLPHKVLFNDAVFNLSRVALLLGSIFSERWDLLSDALQDKLHQNQRKALVPGVNSVICRARNAGALGAALSGSGPTVVAFALNRENEIGVAMQKKFLEFGINSDILIADFNTTGANLILTP